MYVKKINLYNFRNYKNLNLSFNNKVNILLGDNGQGKTNLMESIFLISHGTSFRPSKTSNFVLKNQTQTACKINVCSNEIESNLSFKIIDERKKYLVNEKPISSTKISTYLKTIIFSPESLSAIKEGPDKRRQLIDDTLVLIDRKGKMILDEFKKCLKIRSKLLKDNKNGLIDQRHFNDILDSLNQKYLPICMELTNARLRVLKGLLPFTKDSINKLFENEDVEISVEYNAHSEDIFSWDEIKTEELFTKRMSQLKMAEIDAGISLFGPQKHDISFMFKGENSRYYCSQGQQRALILSVKMAEVLYYYNKFQDYPVLLLDDVMSELDKKRRECLLEFLSEVDAQIFISTTDLSINEKFFENKKEQVTIFNIKNGEVKE